MEWDSHALGAAGWCWIVGGHSGHWNGYRRLDAGGVDQSSVTIASGGVYVEFAIT